MTRRTSSTFSTRGFVRRFLPIHGRGSCATLVWLALAPLAVNAATILEDVEFSSLPGNGVEIDLIFSGTPPTATDFATDNPARIAIDLPDVDSDLSSKELPIEIGVAKSLSTIQVGNRTRVVVNLADSVPYDLTTEGNRIIVGLNKAPPTEAVVVEEVTSSQPGPNDSATQEVVTESTLTEEVRASAPLGAVAEMPRQIGAVRTSRFGRSSTVAQRAALKNVDFRRGADGTGRVIVTLPTATTPVNVREQGNSVLVDIANTQLPQRLFRRLDVVDFATPVVGIESRSEGENIQIKIDTGSDFEYLAYQSDNLFTVEFRGLTPAEKEQQLRDKVVYDGDRLSLNFQDIEVRAVLQLLADFTGLNLVASDKVDGNITLRLQSVPWDQALDIVLKTKGLSMRQTGNVIMVAPTKDIVDQETAELQAHQQIEELAPLRSEFIQVNYGNAADLVTLLKSKENNLLSERGAVSFDERTNTLLVMDTGSKLDQIREMVMRLDIPVRQVLIESRVVIADNNFARELGVRFGVSGSMGRTGDNELLVAGGQAGYLSGATDIDQGPFMGVYGTEAPINSAISAVGSAAGTAAAINSEGGPESLMVNLPLASPSGAIDFLLGKIGSHLLQLELQAMQTEGRGEIVSAPRVVTTDQKEATITVGQRVPYMTVSLEGTETEFQDATLELKVKPHITPDDRVIMDLAVKKDELGGEVAAGRIINKRQVATKVFVDNGETVVLGGVYDEQKNYSKKEVPWLGSLPVIGNLFKTTSRSQQNSELLIFVTPKILKGELVGR